MYLSANCMILPPFPVTPFAFVLEVILPNCPLLMFVFGLPSRKLLVTLKASARNSI